MHFSGSNIKTKNERRKKSLPLSRYQLHNRSNGQRIFFFVRKEIFLLSMEEGRKSFFTLRNSECGQWQLKLLHSVWITHISEWKTRILANCSPKTYTHTHASSSRRVENEIGSIKMGTVGRVRKIIWWNDWHRISMTTRRSCNFRFERKPWPSICAVSLGMR